MKNKIGYFLMYGNLFCAGWMVGEILAYNVQHDVLETPPFKLLLAIANFTVYLMVKNRLENSKGE